VIVACRPVDSLYRTTGGGRHRSLRRPSARCIMIMRSPNRWSACSGCRDLRPQRSGFR